MSDLDNKIAVLKDKLNTEKKCLQYAEGQTFRNSEREIADLELELFKLESSNKLEN